jgi:hypothetical protein
MAAILYKWFFVSALFPFLTSNVTSQAAFNVKKTFHPFYVSVTEINHNAENHTLEISCKMFAEDLEEILRTNYKSPVSLGATKDKGRLDQLIPDYINKHLAITVDGKPVKLTYIGFEKDKESAYCYLQVDDVKAIKKINISNSILYDFNEGEINIVHVMVGGKRHSTKLNFPDKQAAFNF